MQERTYKGANLIDLIDDYVVVDLETTGFSPCWDMIIELGAVKVSSGEIAGTYQTLVNPESPIDNFVTEHTGITNDMLSTAPVLCDVLQPLIDFIGDAVIVAHNANFDINFLYDNCKDILDTPFKNNYIDTMRLSRKLFRDEPHHRLCDLVDRCELGGVVEHRSLSDAMYTYQAYEWFKAYIVSSDIDIVDLARKARSSSGIKASDIISDNIDIDESTPVYGKSFAFTGTLDGLVRKEAIQLVVDMGGLVSNGVTKQTNYLVLGNNDYCTSIKDGKSIKHKKAEQLKLSGKDIEIISEDVFCDLVTM